MTTTPRTIKARLEKLEEAATTGEARQILVSNSGELSDEAVHAFLATQGIVVGKNDMLVRMITIYETQSGEPEPVAGPPALLGVHPLKR